MTIFKHILVPTDFDEPAAAAMKVALDMARDFGARLTLLHVYEIPAYSYYSGPSPVEFAAALEKAAREKMAETALAAQKVLPSVHSLLCEGDPAREILNQIPKLNADLLVIGTHGRRGLSHLLLGSVAEKLVRLASVPVMTVRGPKARG